MKTIKELRKEAKSLEPIIRIGKGGIKESLINEIMKALKNRKLIKIKILKSVKSEKDTIIGKILEATGARFVEKVGNVAVIYKEIRIN